MTTQAFLPGIGFRAEGTRLARETSVTRDGLTLTVRDLVATPQSTDLRYDITDGSDGAACIVPSPGKDPFDSGAIVLRVGDAEFKGAMRRSARVISGGMRFSLDGPRLPADTRHVELRVMGGHHGDWTVPLELVPFSAADSAMTELDASVTHEDVTIQVKGISRTATGTAISFEVRTRTPKAFPAGAGGMHSMRRGPTVLKLRDDAGVEYEEIPQDDRPSAAMGEELAVFGPIAADAQELELVVPFVFVNEDLPPTNIALPVAEPVAASLGPYPFRVLSTGPAPDSRRRQNFGPALSIAVDFGGWHGDRRVLFPMRIQVDGNDRGIGYGNGINATDPTPAETLEVRPEPESPKVLMFQGGTIQVRGPWRVRFAID